MKKIGILGGTFDPPHLGHLIIAEEAYHSCKLDEVWFMPVNQPPHKNRIISEAGDRFNMVKIAIATNPHFKLCDIELEREGRSYTVDTIRELKSRYPDCAFYFIIGGDMAEDLPNWRGINELAQMVSFIAFERPGFTEPKGNDLVKMVKIPSPAIRLSSTELRTRIRENRTTTYYLPEEVKKYIEENRLYEI